MQITSTDGTFSVVLTPTPGTQGHFIFTLRVGDTTLGDAGPAMEWASVRALSHLPSLDHPRLDPDRYSALEICNFLRFENRVLEPSGEDMPSDLHDQARGGFGEAMDRYDHYTYLWGDEAVFLFREHEAATYGAAHPLSNVWDVAVMARVSRSELAAIAAATEAAFAAYDATRPPIG